MDRFVIRAGSIAGLLILLLAGCSPSGTSSASPSPSLGQETVRMVRNVPIDSSTQVGALSLGAGEVWVASLASPPFVAGVPAAGKLLRYDALNGAQLSPWATVGDPVAMAVDGPFVWVGGSAGDASGALADSDAVVQVNSTTGAVSYRYPVGMPAAIVAAGDSAWVLAGGVGSLPTLLLSLNRGHVRLLATLAGQPASNPGFTGQALAECGSLIYVATRTNATSVSVSQIPIGGGTAEQISTLSTDGYASLACTEYGVVVAVKSPDHGGLYRVGAPAASATRIAGPRSPSDLAVVTTALWVVDQPDVNSAAQVYVFSVRNGSAVGRVDLPIGDARLLAADSSGAWAIAGSTLLELRS